MSDNERADHKTRFKKGQSGNPGGRPKGRKSQRTVLHEVLFKPIRVKVSGGYRTLPKIAAMLEVCLNNALKGDIKSFTKIMEFAQKNGLFDPANDPDNRITAIELIVVEPKPLPEELMPPAEYRSQSR